MNEYNYNEQRPFLFTEEGLEMVLKVRDNVQRLLNEAGAFQAEKAWKDLEDKDPWDQLTALDYLVERGEIKCVTRPEIAGQHQVYVKAWR